MSDGSVMGGLSNWKLSGLWDVALGSSRIPHTGKSVEQAILLNYSARDIKLSRLLHRLPVSVRSPSRRSYSLIRRRIWMEQPGPSSPDDLLLLLS